MCMFFLRLMYQHKSDCRIICYIFRRACCMRARQTSSAQYLRLRALWLASSLGTLLGRRSLWWVMRFSKNGLVVLQSVPEHPVIPPVLCILTLLCPCGTKLLTGGLPYKPHDLKWANELLNESVSAEQNLCVVGAALMTCLKVKMCVVTLVET